MLANALLKPASHTGASARLSGLVLIPARRHLLTCICLPKGRRGAVCSIALSAARLRAPSRVFPINVVLFTLPLILRTPPPIAFADGTLELLRQSSIRLPRTLHLQLVFQLCILQGSRLKLSMRTQQIFLETTDFAFSLPSARKSDLRGRPHPTIELVAPPLNKIRVLQADRQQGLCAKQ